MELFNMENPVWIKKNGKSKNMANSKDSEQNI